SCPWMAGIQRTMPTNSAKYARRIKTSHNGRTSNRPRWGWKTDGDLGVWLNFLPAALAEIADAQDRGTASSASSEEQRRRNSLKTFQMLEGAHGATMDTVPQFSFTGSNKVGDAIQVRMHPPNHGYTESKERFELGPYVPWHQGQVHRPTFDSKPWQLAE